MDEITVSATTRQAATRATPRSTSLLPPSPHSHTPPVPPLHRSSLFSATDRKSGASPAIPPPAVPPLPSFFINYRNRRAWREEPGRSTQLADPAVLPNDNVAAPSSPPPLLLHPTGCRLATSWLQWRFIHSGWNYRKTKIENEVSCFIAFIDE